jgi:hypothetical protein
MHGEQGKLLRERFRPMCINSIFIFPELTFHDLLLEPHQTSIFRLNNLEINFNSILRELFFKSVLLLTSIWYQFNHQGIQFYHIYHYSRLAFCLFFALPTLLKINFWGPSFGGFCSPYVLSIVKIMLGEHAELLIEYLRAQTKRTKKNGAGNIFLSTNDKCEPIPKPPYLSGIVTYEVDQTAIFHSNSAQIQFLVSKIFFSVIFTSNCHDDVMIAPPQQASRWSWRLIYKKILRPANCI